MSEAKQVDFSQIRGDWHFHLNYLANAIQSMLDLATRLWQQVGDDAGAPAIGEALEKVRDCWEELRTTADDEDPFDINSRLLDEFMALVAATKEPCDALEEARQLQGSASIYDRPLEQFTEAMRGLRAFNPDLEMMREQKP
ncbi:MAG: hypothetical protein D6727_07685 [Gammaproteobacteria bacterium]|nr:MAG: hypothetical protein D6727_07685 [Gammaproteobacteria bacterium]